MNSEGEDLAVIRKIVAAEDAKVAAEAAKRERTWGLLQFSLRVFSYSLLSMFLSAAVFVLGVLLMVSVVVYAGVFGC